MAKYNVNQWLLSDEFKRDIESALNNIIRKAEMSESESSTASAFENEIYYLIRRSTGREVVFTKEKRVGGVLHTFGDTRKSKGRTGRLDAVVNRLVIEYKHRTKLKTAKDIESAFEQTGEYLVGLERSSGQEYSAILTDGIQIAYFSFIGEGRVAHTSLRPMKPYDMENVIEAILSNGQKKFSPANIVSDFSVSPRRSSIAKCVAVALHDELCNNITDKTRMLLSEWETLMHFSASDEGRSRDVEKRRRDLSDIFVMPISSPAAEYRALFALQTTYAVIVKLLACKVIDTLNLSDSIQTYHDLLNLDSKGIQAFFSNMEDGYTYRSMGISNFLEGDYFSWYSDREQWSGAFYLSIKDVLERVDEYTSFSIEARYSPIDIFKNLYMHIIPRSVRHSMGEFFTPEWLADSVITEGLSLLNKEKWTAIDPCCGSGIFVISLIKKVVGDNPVLDMEYEERKRIMEEILHRVRGIDINPLSVLSARVSYYIALRKLGVVKEVEIPIYLGDSAVIPQTVVIDGISCYHYSISNLKNGFFNIDLPVRMVKSKNFGDVMDKIQAMVKAENPDVIYDLIVRNFSGEEATSLNLLFSVRELADNLVYLHKNNWDGIWVRICTNFMLIARLEKFDFIVGNPPWVKWEHLPSEYAKKIKEYCDVRHIFCNDGGIFGGSQLNICALIANVTASSWLSQDGILAFLMPDSIMSQNSYEEFRNFYTDYGKGKRLYMQEVDRWLPPFRPFKVGNKPVTQDFNTYYFGSRETDYKAGVNVRNISKIRGADDVAVESCQTWEEASLFFSVAKSCARQLSESSTAFTYTEGEWDFSLIVGDSAYLYRTGVESTPFEIFKLIGNGRSERPGHYLFKNDKRKTARYKVIDTPPDGWDFSTAYIYPMVQAPFIRPFSFNCANSFHIIPYKENDTKMPVPMEELFREDSDLAVYFASHRELIESQSEKSKAMHRGKAFYALSKIGEYTFAENIVAARDNSNFCASVITPTLTPWGETKKSVCVKHTIIISQDVENNFISADEAHYINGVLNSSVVKSYIHSTFKKNGFSLKKSHLFLPKYQKGNPLFERIVSLSKEATYNESKVSVNIGLLSEAYISLCKALKR